jgi:ABC-2 type transport system permease protein
MWQQVYALIIKEILIILRDPKARITLIGPPILQLFLFSHAATLEVKNVNLGIFNEDNGRYGFELVQRISGSPFVTAIHPIRTIEKMKEVIDNQEAMIALRISQDFSRQITDGHPGSVEMVLDGRRSNSAQITQGYILEIINNFNQEIILAQTGKSITFSADTLFRSWFNPNLDYLLYTVPCLVGILSMLLGLILTSLSIARERELGTLDQLLVSPLQPWQIFVGKTIPSLVIGVAESCLMMLIIFLFFDVPFRGSFFFFFISLTIYVMSMLGIGLFISTISKTQQQASLGTFLFMVPAMLLSGFATPVENMPHWLQPVSQFLPNTHFFIIVKGVFLKAMPPLEILSNTIPIFLIGVVTLIFAGWVFKHRLE